MNLPNNCKTKSFGFRHLEFSALGNQYDDDIQKLPKKHF
jgi:hypothetical protein